MMRLREGEAYLFSRVVHLSQDVVEVEINCTRVADTDPIIALRRPWLKLWASPLPVRYGLPRKTLSATALKSMKFVSGMALQMMK